MKYFLIITTILLFQSCSPQEPKIVITKDYIINKHWDDKRNNAILIERMKVKNGGILDANSPDFDKEIRSNWDLNNKLEVDDTFRYSYAGLDIKGDRIKLKGKVFFNKDNGFYWNFGSTYYDHKKTEKNTIGRLENNTWYKFSDLKTIAYYVYIYVDNLGELHRYNVNMSNY
jgi:hypothetical protein